MDLALKIWSGTALTLLVLSVIGGQLSALQPVGKPKKKGKVRPATPKGSPLGRARKRVVEQRQAA